MKLLLRFCSNPIPFGRGKKCPFPVGVTRHKRDVQEEVGRLKREGRSLVEERECKSKDEGGDLPVCKGFPSKYYF